MNECLAIEYVIKTYIFKSKENFTGIWTTANVNYN